MSEHAFNAVAHASYTVPLNTYTDLYTETETPTEQE